MKVGDKFCDRCGAPIAIEIIEIRETAIVSKITMGPVIGQIITDTKEDFVHFWEPFQ